MASAAPSHIVGRSGSSVCAIVVTFNRKEMLSKCLRAILNQTISVEHILLIDNGSSDGTRSFLTELGLLSDPRIEYWRFEKNKGPAFAFHAGFWKFRQGSEEWAWVMDDDVVPDPTALEELLKAYGRAFTSPEQVGFLTSCVRSHEGDMVSVPVVDLRKLPNGYADWNHLMSEGLVKVRACTFNSILFPKSTVIQFGLPKVDFFIWGEDSDYTRTITSKRPGYLVGSSSVVHWRNTEIILERIPDRYPYLFYFYRNNLYIARQYGEGKFDFIRVCIRFSLNVVYSLFTRPFSLARSKALLFGVLAGLTFNPSDASPMEEFSERTASGQEQRPVA